MNRVSPVIFIVFLITMTASMAWADNSGVQKSASEQNDSSVMQSFADREVKNSEIITIKDETKRLVMFFMGVPLLLLLATTVALGVAMVIYEKKVFVAHMICAGLSMTLAIAHAVVGIVWFYPF